MNDTMMLDEAQFDEDQNWIVESPSQQYQRIRVYPNLVVRCGSSSTVCVSGVRSPDSGGLRISNTVVLSCDYDRSENE